jgi:hypothetical protein
LIIHIKGVIIEKHLPMLLGSVVIDAEFGSENHGSIPYNCDQEGAETT